MNLINDQPDIGKIYLYNKDPYEAKYQHFINKRENVYKNIDEYNVYKERKILIVSDDMIAYIIKNIKINSIVTDVFIGGTKLNISLVFITQSHFKFPKDVRLNSTHFFIMKILNKRVLQQIALNHSLEINSKYFIKIYKKCTAERYSFLVNDATLASDNPLRFRKSLFNI